MSASNGERITEVKEMENIKRAADKVYPNSRNALYAVWRISRGRKFITASAFESKAYRVAADCEQLYGGAYIVEKVIV